MAYSGLSVGQSGYKTTTLAHMNMEARQHVHQAAELWRQLGATRHRADLGDAIAPALDSVRAFLSLTNTATDNVNEVPEAFSYGSGVSYGCLRVSERL